MKTRIISVGNSKGIRIPKTVLEQVGLFDEVEMSVDDGSLVIRPAAKARAAWSRAFREMAKRGDDALLDPDHSGATRWDQDQWEW
jgi:antitoxin MazE